MNTIFICIIFLLLGILLASLIFPNKCKEGMYFGAGGGTNCQGLLDTPVEVRAQMEAGPLGVACGSELRTGYNTNRAELCTGDGSLKVDQIATLSRVSGISKQELNNCNSGSGTDEEVEEIAILDAAILSGDDVQNIQEIENIEHKIPFGGITRRLPPSFDPDTASLIADKCKTANTQHGDSNISRTRTSECINEVNQKLQNVGGLQYNDITRDNVGKHFSNQCGFLKYILNNLDPPYTPYFVSTYSDIFNKMNNVCTFVGLDPAADRRTIQ